VDDELIRWCALATRAACSRRRLLDLIRAGDAGRAAAEMEHHLHGPHFMWRLSRTSEPGGIAV
jgi:DNA-binding FadR family transcriptional regulator